MSKQELSPVKPKQTLKTDKIPLHPAFKLRVDRIDGSHQERTSREIHAAIDLKVKPPFSK